MTESLLTYWAAQAFGLAVAFAICLLLAEGWWSRAKPRAALGPRWVANLFTCGASMLIMQWLPPLSLLATALLAQQKGWGLFNWLIVPQYLAIVCSWLAVDLCGYLLHRLEHQTPLLWRVHRLHHSDPDVDVTTAYRFHALEVVLRAIVAASVVVAIGAPPAAAAGYVILTSLVSVLSHANVSLPRAFEQFAGILVITPSIHRTHHSIDPVDAHSNFSVCLSCWDRLFRTYRLVPTLGHANIEFGVASRTAADATSLVKTLLDPFLPERQAGQAGDSVVAKVSTAIR